MKKMRFRLLPNESETGSSPFTEDEDVTASSETVAEAEKLHAGVAQLVRAPACHAGGRGFEPRHSRHFSRIKKYLSPPYGEDCVLRAAFTLSNAA